jgi:protein ImuB
MAGMKLSEARAVCANLIWKDYDAQLYKLAQQRLCQELIACSPKVSAMEPGSFLLDASGLNYLGGEKRFCLQVQKIAARAGYQDVGVGVADSAFAATVASKFKRQRCFIVDHEGDRQFLAPLSIKHLPISSDMQESLLNLGIRSIGHMVNLSPESLRERFGKEGATAVELAQGIDNRHPSLPPLEKEFKCVVDLGSAIELLNEIQFVLKSMIDRLTVQLKQEGFWAEELQLSFYNDDECIDQRPIKLLRPANHPKFLLEVVKLSLEAKPLQREVTAMSVAVSHFGKESWQQLEIDSAGSQEEKNAQQSMSLTLMLQRFMSRLGEDAVVKSVANDQHIPEKAATWVSVTNKPSVLPVVPVNISYVNTHVSPTALASGLALHKFPAPQPVLVEFQGEQPGAVAFDGRWYRIQEITSPERLSGLWWEQPVRRSYYVALMQPRQIAAAEEEDILQSLLVLLVQDHEAGSWCISGIYD